MNVLSARRHHPYPALERHTRVVRTSHATMNSWEACALEYEYPEYATDQIAQATHTVAQSTTFDRIIYPGIYSSSGFDVLGILLHISRRPNPSIDLGAIDASCPLVMCDLKQPDSPIVYASDSFTYVTGFNNSEVLGKNCRFLQAPGGKVRPRSKRAHVDSTVVRSMRKAVEKNAELQIEVVNFKKNGEQFVNILAIIPVCYKASEFNYSVGFMCEKEDD